jgi:hypothetical protein
VRSIIVLFVVTAVSLISCRKKPDPVVVPQIVDHGGVNANDGHLNVVFENVVGDQPLVLNTGIYTNEAGNSFTVKIYKYYISNIKLWRDDSTYFAESGGYYLVNEALTSSKAFTIHGVPSGTYTGISFLLGVDSARNVSGAQTGALDPLNAMYWDWNTGYIMAKLEGSSPQSGALGKEIIFHLGGFSGKNNVLREISLPLPSAAIVTASATPDIHIKSDVLQWFKEPLPIDFATTYTITDPGNEATAFSAGYADMFTADHVEN